MHSAFNTAEDVKGFKAKSLNKFKVNPLEGKTARENLFSIRKISCCHDKFFHHI
jgi:hypothetical protein